MEWASRIAIVLCWMAGGLPAHAQAVLSCVPLFEARQLNKSIKPEIRTAIVDTVRQYARERKLLWQRRAPVELPCMDLACVDDEEIVNQVVLQCAGNPFQKLESAALSIAPPREKHSGGIY
jgi:hypothetical protein